MKNIIRIGLVALSILALLLWATPVAAQSCPSRGRYRWDAKVHRPVVHDTLSVTISDILAWESLPLNRSDRCAVRQGRETQMYHVQGWVRTIKPEDDGDIHIEITTTSTDSLSRCIVVEVPASTYSTRYRDARLTLNAAVPPSKRSGTRVLTPVRLHFIGPAFFDGWHATSRDHGHCNITAWELHPITRIYR